MALKRTGLSKKSILLIKINKSYQNILKLLVNIFTYVTYNGIMYNIKQQEVIAWYEKK